MESQKLKPIRTTTQEEAVAENGTVMGSGRSIEKSPTPSTLSPLTASPAVFTATDMRRRRLFTGPFQAIKSR